jgi:hypothetical protein
MSFYDAQQYDTLGKYSRKYSSIRIYLGSKRPVFPIILGKIEYRYRAQKKPPLSKGTRIGFERLKLPLSRLRSICRTRKIEVLVAVDLVIV